MKLNKIMDINKQISDTKHRIMSYDRASHDRMLLENQLAIMIQNESIKASLVELENIKIKLDRVINRLPQK